MNRVLVTLRRQLLTPSGPTERAVYSEASIGPERAALELSCQAEPRTLLLRTSAHAAILEGLARMIRIELAEQEQQALRGEVYGC